MDKYTVAQHSVGNVLNWVETGKIAIPEIQRPFVWSSTKVRDLIDSLYQGYPVGYLITWQNTAVRLKDGSLSGSKQILIDGQQRVTALTTAKASPAVVRPDPVVAPGEASGRPESWVNAVMDHDTTNREVRCQRGFHP